jgi:lysophospholipase L1-like esterase
MKYNKIRSLICILSFILTPLNIWSQSLITDSLNVLGNIENCPQWNTFKDNFHNSVDEHKSKTQILFIGDSHTQAGFYTNQIRNKFSENGIVTGRGLIFPYKLAKTNGPEDVFLKSSNSYLFRKWNLANSKTDSPFGYSLQTTEKELKFLMGFKIKNETNYFNQITVFYSGDSIKFSSLEPFTDSASGKINDSINFKTISFSKNIDSVEFKITKNDSILPLNLYGFQWGKSNESLVVNSIGINGITYKQYSDKINIAPWLKFLNPSCLIINLGTNDVYSLRCDTSQLYPNINAFVQKIKTLLPSTAIILITPNDHLIKRRYFNKSIKTIASVIQRVAKNNNCIYWNFYKIMGGPGSARRWQKAGYLYRDYVHLTKNGYNLFGSAFFETYFKALNQ